MPARAETAETLREEESVHRDSKLVDVMESESCGDLRTTSWFHKDHVIRVCKCQKLRYHTGGSIWTSDVQRLLTRPSDKLPFPEVLARQLIDALPAAPVSRRERDRLDCRLEKYEAYPSRATDVLSVCFKTKSKDLSLRGREVRLMDTVQLPALPDVPVCFVQFVREKPFPHCYLEHVL